MEPKKAKEWIEVIREGLSLIPKSNNSQPPKKTPIIPPEKTKFHLNGKCIVVTGTISMHRPEFEQKLIKVGARLGKSITNSTDLLIVGMKPGEIKIKDAKEKSVPIVSWKMFLQMIS
jgi:NAD-dependent DNA ligase